MSEVTGSRERRLPRLSRLSPRATYSALVLDDDEENLAFLSMALSSFVPGFEVATARNLNAATQWMETFVPDLVIVDAKFVRGDGREFAAGLRRDPRTRLSKVLVMLDRVTAQSDLDPQLTWIEAALSKPLGLQQLLASVRELLEVQTGH